MMKTGGILDVKLDAVKIDQKSAEKIPNLKKGEYIRLTISDTGHGMDIKTKERILNHSLHGKRLVQDQDWVSLLCMA